jgi:hypothetical protein
MCIRAFAAIILTFTAISCQPSPKSEQGAMPSTEQSQSKNGTNTVIVDGRQATPLEQQAFESVARELFSDILNDALKKWRAQLLNQLEITDPMEAAHFTGPVDVKELESDKQWDGELLSWSVYLIRPGKEIKEARTITLLHKGKPFIRFTRTTEAIERPIAVMAVTGTNKDGGVYQTDFLLVYGHDCKWKQYPASNREEDLKRDK